MVMQQEEVLMGPWGCRPWPAICLVIAFLWIGGQSGHGALKGGCTGSPALTMILELSVH